MCRSFASWTLSARNAARGGAGADRAAGARERGYRSLMRLNSRAFLETPIHQSPHIKFEWLEATPRTDCPERRSGGPISLAIDADHADLAATRCDGLASLSRPALHRIAAPRHREGTRTEAALIDLAYAKGFPVVATNEPYFATADDYEPTSAALHRRRRLVAKPIAIN